MQGTTYWILLFSAIHLFTALLFLTTLGTITLIGSTVGFILLSIANYIILQGKTAQSGMKTPPLFHVTMLIYAASIILEYWL
jgi:4-hydroxybenzoate polyprenyltransferase